MSNNSSKSSKKKSGDNVTSMTSSLPSRRINLNSIGRNSIRAVKNYLKMRSVKNIVDMTIALGQEQTGLSMPKDEKAKEKKVLKYWAKEINKDIDYEREQKKERDRIERAKKTAQNKIKGVVSSNFNSLTLYRKNKNNTSYAYKVDFSLDSLNTQKITLYNYLTKASIFFDKTIGELLKSSPIVAYKLPNNRKVIIQPTQENETTSSFSRASEASWTN